MEFDLEKMDSRDGYQENSAFCRIERLSVNEKRYFSKDRHLYITLSERNGHARSNGGRFVRFGC